VKQAFVGTRHFKDDKQWDWVLIGLPLDLTETFRQGAAEGPEAIRYASESIETYSPFLDVDLEEFAIADYGNLEFNGMDIEQAIEHIKLKTSKLKHYRLAFLGGEHTVTLGVLKAYYEEYGNDLYLVVADAHTDLRDEYEGLRLSHATWLKRAVEFLPPENVVLIGVRSGTRAEFQERLLEMREDVEIEDSTMEKLVGAKAVYLSIDIDALDAPYVPGCGNPEPGGLHYKEVEEFVHWLGTSTNLIGFDVVEVAPRYDISQLTAVTAARLVREVMAASLYRKSVKL
jgi:agmatinase